MFKASKSKAQAMFQASKSKEEEFVTTRKNVTKKLDSVFEFRDDLDLYTNQKKDVVVKSTPNVDHILEIQMIDKVYYNAPVAYRTRAGYDGFSKLVNDIPALNVTTRKVNMAKMGAMKAFLNRADRTFLRPKTFEESFSDKVWRENGVCANIGKAIVTTYDDYICKKIEECVGNTQLASAILDNLTEYIGKMNI